MGASRYELLTRPGCHLCEEMAHTLDQVLPAFGLSYVPVNVDQEPRLKARYGEVVPVLLRDGRAVAKVRLDVKTLTRIVRRRRFGL